MNGLNSTKTSKRNDHLARTHLLIFDASSLSGCRSANHPRDRRSSRRWESCHYVCNACTRSKVLRRDLVESDREPRFAGHGSTKQTIPAPWFDYVPSGPPPANRNKARGVGGDHHVHCIDTRSKWIWYFRCSLDIRLDPEPLNQTAWLIDAHGGFLTSFLGIWSEHSKFDAFFSSKTLDLGAWRTITWISLKGNEYLNMLNTYNAHLQVVILDNDWSLS